MDKLRIKNWTSFQHYKDRSPPWIKLHKGLLDDYDFHCLPVASRALAPCLWLLASESEDGSIDLHYSRIAFRLRMTDKEVEAALKPLISAGFVILERLASESLADSKQDAMPEKEREVEKEREAEGEKEHCRAEGPDPINVVFAYWKGRMNHPRAALDDKRRKTIKAALAMKYSVRDLCDAIDGCALTPFNMGQNDRGEVYDSLDLILRNAEKIDRFIRNKQAPPRMQNKNHLQQAIAQQEIDEFVQGAPDARHH